MDKNVFKNITYGLYVVTSKYNDILSGCIVNTVSQITSVDPVVAISINKNNYTNEIIKKSNIVAISILDVNTNKDLISKFGYKSSKDIDKFTDTSYELIDEVPVVKENTNGYIIGKVINIIDVNTHDIFLVSVSKSALFNGDDSLTYKDYQLKMKGTSPKNAPTYIEVETNKTSSNKYRCIICGHIYDDGVEEIPFHLLPDDWVCPVCGVSKDKFEKIN